MTNEAYGAPGEVGVQVAAVRAIYAAFARRDLDAALEHLSADIELLIPATAGLAGREHPYRGHDGVRAYFADLQRVWGELSLHAEDVRAAAGGVIVFGHVRGTMGEEVVRRRVVWTWKLVDDLAVRVSVNDLAES